eukprot:4253469-Pyramimonas_sp.AAC.1
MGPFVRTNQDFPWDFRNPFSTTWKVLLSSPVLSASAWRRGPYEDCSDMCHHSQAYLFNAPAA